MENRGWKEIKLGDYLDSISKTFKFTDKEVVFLNTSDVLEGKVLNKKYESPIGLPGQAKKSIQKGDLLFSEIRPANKRYARIDFDSEDYVVSTKLMVLRAKRDLDPIFLELYITSEEILDYLQMIAEDRSGTFPQITFDIISKLELKLPPLPEQKAIASVLSSLDDKIDLLHQQNQTLETLAETLFRQWFIERCPEPVEGEAKEGWEEKSLSSIANFLNGLACQNYPPKDSINRLPVLKIKDLTSGISENSDWASTDVRPEYIIKNGDVIFAWSASLMVKIWNGEDCILNQHLFKVTSEEFPKWFYYFWCKQHLREFISIAQSHATTMGHIKRSDLDEAMVLIPDNAEIEKMTFQMNPILDKIQLNNNQINSLSQLRDTLLPKLMSGAVSLSNCGEVRVKI